MPTIQALLGQVGLEVQVIGLDRQLARLSPSRMERAVERATGLGIRYLLNAIRADSRVGKTRAYKAGWRATHRGNGVRAIINEVKYAPYVRGLSQPSTFPGGRRRGASASFLRKIKAENTSAVRQIMRERILREFE